MAAHRLALLVLAGCTSSTPEPHSPAPPCERGALDAAYCDQDGNMVADTPTDAAAHLDPRTLIFSYTPREDPAVYAKVWDEFITHLSEATGKEVKFFPVQSYAAQYAAMRAGRLPVATGRPVSAAGRVSIESSEITRGASKGAFSRGGV